MTPTLTASAPSSGPRPPTLDTRLLADRPDLATHLGRLGSLPALGPELIAQADQAGLTGRGGASFPTARKLAAVASRPGPRVAVANATEGEPLSVKDRTLLVHSPHLVLDGLEAAARAVGARRRILCVERGNRVVLAAVEAALAERGNRGVEIVSTPRRYVTGQETALVDYINGGPGRPTGRRPFEQGVGGRPTLVDNVETLAQLALIARRPFPVSPGRPADPGHRLVSLSGSVAHPGVYEIPPGTALRVLLDHAGAARPRGVLIGGYFGRWLTPREAATATLDPDSLAARRASLGCGVIAVIDSDTCAVAELARVAAWFAGASARQCGACTWGLRDLATATAAIAAGTPDPAAPADVARWTEMIKGRGACRLPDGAAAFLESAMEVFADEIELHQTGRCPRPDLGLLPTPDPEPWP